MFASARIKLTIWYVLILMAISTFFSLAFYKASTLEVQRLLNRSQMEEQRQSLGVVPRRNRPIEFPSTEELKAITSRIKFNLLILNSIILCIGGGASYVLAGKTLRPIQEMVTEQQTFITNASHELRTPIATLRAEMESQLLEKKISDKQARSLITSNLEELGVLQQLTNDLLTLITIHHTDVQPMSGQFSIDETLEKIVDRAKTASRLKKIIMKLEAQPGLITGSKEQISQAISAIIDNAIKYSKSNAKISVMGNSQKKYYAIAVKDSGIGISEADLPYVFDRFYRASGARTKEGYGLGLSIAKSIIERHGGTLTVKSRLGKGSTFLIHLPLA